MGRYTKPQRVSRYTKPQRVSVSMSIVQPTGKQTIVERAKRILADNNLLSTEEWFILTQIHLICLFRRARTESRKRKIDKYLSRREERYISRKKDPQIGLTPQDFIGLNQWVVNQDLADKQHNKLEALIKRVKQCKRQARREAKRAKT